MSFDKALAFSLGWEGGYNHIKGDRGGETNFGIADLRDGVPDGMTDVDGDGKPDTRIRNLTRAQAAEIYERDYWQECACNTLSEPLDILVFDAAVNHSPRLALKFLAQSGQNAKKYCDVREDFYRQLVARKPDQAKFLKGWLRRANACRALTVG